MSIFSIEKCKLHMVHTFSLAQRLIADVGLPKMVLWTRGQQTPGRSYQYMKKLLADYVEPMPN